MEKAMTRRFAIALALGISVVTPVLIGSFAVAQDSQASSQEFMDANKKMMDAMNMKPSGDADKDFAMMMIPHHQGAIEMAKIELEYGKDPTLKKMAKKIIDAQEKEIKEFKQWQQKHGMGM
jgi:uncharacterized protein (DUF305 family)